MGGSLIRTVTTRAVVAAALVLPLGWAGVAAAAKVAKPVISGFAATPSTVSGPSGAVLLSGTTTGATSCSVSSTSPSVTLTPASGACPSGVVSSTLFVPEDTGKRPVKVHVAVTATGPGGSRTAKVVVQVDPGDGGRGVPTAPLGVTATALDRSAVVDVAPPASDGGEPVLGYTVVAVDLTSAGRGGQTASGASSPLTVTGLADGDAYEFTATATNLDGTGTASAPRTRSSRTCCPARPPR